MGGDVDRLWNEENHPLVGPTPLIVQSTVVPEGHLGWERKSVTESEVAEVDSQLKKQTCHFQQHEGGAGPRGRPPQQAAERWDVGCPPSPLVALAWLLPFLLHIPGENRNVSRKMKFFLSGDLFPV